MPPFSVPRPYFYLVSAAFVVYCNWVQANASFPEFLTFHGQTTVADSGGGTLFTGPDDAPALAHVFLNVTQWSPGNTASGRPGPDFLPAADGLPYLCSDVR